MLKRSPHLSWRLLTLMAGFFIVTLLLIGRLAYLQVINHAYYVEQARDEHLASQSIPAHRGAILDRNGYPLAISIDAYDVLIDRSVWRTWSRAQQGAEALSQVLGMPAEAILQSATAPGETFYLLRSRLDYQRGRQVIELGLPGVSVRNTSRRYYPEGDLAANILGFVGQDHQGLAGIEADFEDELAGKPGTVYFERDTRGNPIPFGRRHVVPPTPGRDIVLTIDRYIQRIAEQQLDEAIRQHRASGGSILVMDPKTGAILAMASRPSFRYAELDFNDPEKLRLTRNIAVTDYYEPGSVVKVLTTAAAIDLRLVNPNTTYIDNGTVKVYDATITNWDFSINGPTTVTQYLQKSLNTGSVWLAGLIGADRFYDYMKRFGFGQRTGIEFSAESPGLLRTQKDPGWTPVDLATNSYGQGIGATPVQVLAALSAVANGGILMRPYIVQEIAGPGKHTVTQPQPVRRVIAEDSARIMRQLMNEVVDGVKSHLAQMPGYRVGGKTGTTLVSIPGGYDLESTIASFVGFVPADDPVLGILIKIDQPKDDPLGGRVAAPVFPKVAGPVLTYLDIRPDTALHAQQR